MAKGKILEVIPSRVLPKNRKYLDSKWITSRPTGRMTTRKELEGFKQRTGKMMTRKEYLSSPEYLASPRGLAMETIKGLPRAAGQVLGAPFRGIASFIGKQMKTEAEMYKAQTAEEEVKRAKLMQRIRDLMEQYRLKKY